MFKKWRQLFWKLLTNNTGAGTFESHFTKLAAEDAGTRVLGKKTKENATRVVADKKNKKTSDSGQEKTRVKASKTKGKEGGSLEYGLTAPGDIEQQTLRKKQPDTFAPLEIKRQSKTAKNLLNQGGITREQALEILPNLELLEDGEKIKIGEKFFKKGIELGRGGFGCVYKYEEVNPADPQNPQTVIVKQIKLNKDADDAAWLSDWREQSALKEAAALQALQEQGVSGIPGLQGISFSGVSLENLLPPSLQKSDSQKTKIDPLAKTVSLGEVQTSAGQTPEFLTPAVSIKGNFNSIIIAMDYHGTSLNDQADFFLHEQSGKRYDLETKRYTRAEAQEIIEQMKELPDMKADLDYYQRRKELLRQTGLNDEETTASLRQEIMENLFGSLEKASAVIEKLHQAGYVHLDLKAQNITGQGLIDFGLLSKHFPFDPFLDATYEDYLSRVRNSVNTLQSGTPRYIDMLKYVSSENDKELSDQRMARPENDVYSLARTVLDVFCDVYDIANIGLLCEKKEKESYDPDYYEFIFTYLKFLRKESDPNTSLFPKEFFKAFFVGKPRAEAEGKYRGEQVSTIRPKPRELVAAMKNALGNLTEKELKQIKQMFDYLTDDNTRKVAYENYQSVMAQQQGQPVIAFTAEQQGQFNALTERLQKYGRPFDF